ncbi:MAG: sel1 repeat family protein [Salinarimonas sp.]|nr:sel1 repeat family protein [Salinarimonas sp.]
MARYDMARYEPSSIALVESGTGATDIITPDREIEDGRVFYELGLMYAAGRRVEPDLVSAHKWLNVAVFKGCREAIAHRAELAGEMSREDVAIAQRQAREFLMLH